MAGDPQAVGIEGKASLRITTSSARVTVVAEERADVLLQHGAPTVDPANPNRLLVDGGTGRVEARVPTGTDVVVGSLSGRVELSGSLGAVSVAVESGRVEIEQAAQVDVRATSGRIEIGRCEGLCRVSSGSGRTQIGSSGQTEVMVDSGAIRILEIRGPARLKTTSGRIEVALAGAYDVDAESMSGRIRIVVPADLRPDVTLTSQGRATCDVEVGSDSTIRARSVSGRLEIAPTRPGDR